MGYYNIDKWEPYKKTEKILNKAMEHIKSVKYAVSARWVFYRLLQDGFYSKKKHCDNLSKLTSRARRAYWNGWHPLILTDETREMIQFETYGEPPTDDIDKLVSLATIEAKEEKIELEYRLENYKCSFEYEIDCNYLQDYYVVIAYEARAMTQQFKTYTDNITLIPCGGQPSIPHRYKAAEYINKQSKYYGKPAIVLYFGDCDDAGNIIFNSFEEDMDNWCDNVDVIYCGLNIEQIEEFKRQGTPVPENIEKPGQYQWEGLTDDQARSIIRMKLIDYHDSDAEENAVSMGLEISDKVCDIVDENLENE